MRAHASSGAELAERGEAQEAEDHGGHAHPRAARAWAQPAEAAALEVVVVHLCGCTRPTDSGCFVFLQMQDRPDLIQSELAGLAFDSLQQVFRKCDIEILFNSSPLPCVLGQTIWIVVDPAAGGPQSDYAVVSICRIKGCVVVSALRQHVGLLARVDKVLQRVRVVCEKVEHQHAPQVCDKSA